MSEYTTKKDVENIVNNAIEGFARIVNKGFEDQKKEIGRIVEEKVSEAKRELLESNDKIISDLKTIREEQIMNIAAHDRMQETIDIHGIKIKNLETKIIK
jgi:hypothetical protein